MNIHNGFAIVLVLGIIASSQVSGALAANVLVGMDEYSVLNSYEYLSVLDNYYLVMQPDCDLILYNQSGLPLKHTDSGYGSRSNLNCSLWMQSDGNCVIYNLTTASWTNHLLYGSPSIPWAESNYSDPQWNASFLLLGGDGSLDFYTPNATLRQKNFTNLGVVDVNASSPVNFPKFDPSNSTYKAWEPGVSLDEYPYMPAGYFLSAGKRLRTLISPGFALELNASDCNLQSLQFLYAGGTQSLWNSNNTDSVQNHPCQLELLQNGTLQIRDPNSNDLYWTSGTSGDSTVSWILRLDPDDGTLSVSDITNSNHLLWTNARNSLPPSPQSSAKPTSDRGSVWIVVGEVVGAVVGAFVLAMAALGLYKYARERFLDPADRAFQKRLQVNGGHSHAFSQAKIDQATKNYQTVIGRGGFGDVFYGQLPDGQEVAAKVLSMDSRQSKQEFYNEIELLSKVHHKYLVSLLGYSSTRSHQVLIYEYMGGGDLRHRLQVKSDAGVPLSWLERTNIILQVAEGLEYLHEKCSPPIIHRDIKSTNILLTSKLVAKVADFGLSKLKAIGQEDATHVTTVVKGTPGYLDPEYHETGLLTEKSDVYAFGIVLMEVLTGQHHMLIANRVAEAWRQHQLHDLADPQLGDGFDRTMLVSLVELALWCVRRSNLERPFMRQVVRRLHELLLVPSEASEPNIDFGDEEKGSYTPADIELMMMDSSENFSTEATPLNTGSSSSAASLEVRHHPG